MQKLEKTELRKAGRTVGVNCNTFSKISSGTAPLLQGMLTTEKRRYNFIQPRQKPIVLQLKVDRCNKLINDKITKMEYNKKWTIKMN